MAVENAINSENRTSTIYVDSNEKIECEGEMTGGDRLYEKASISEDGVLTFYEEDVDTNFVSHLKPNGNGNTNIYPKFEKEYNYNAKNSFNLGQTTNNNALKLKVGEKFEEMTAINGDYVQLGEDGKTFYVYDKTGNQIDSCSYQTVEQHDIIASEMKEFIGIVAAATILGVGGTVAGLQIAGKNITPDK